MSKVDITVGYLKSGFVSDNYKIWERKKLIGGDITIIDGKENKIIIGAREGGTRIEVNGKEIQY